MKYSGYKNTLCVILSKNELWYLAQLFGPGWVFGFEDPTKGFSEAEIISFEENAIETLSKEGLLIHKGGNQIQVDELLGGMVYSCLNSTNMLVVKNRQSKTEIIFHFLPQWQMEFCKIGDENELTLFKERKDLFQHILFSQDIKLSKFNINGKFTIGIKDLEMAAFMYESGKMDTAREIFNNGYGELPSSDDFLTGYLSPDFHFTFDMLYDRNDEKRIHTSRNELIQLNRTLYWVSHDEAGEEAREVMNFSSIKPSQAERRFYMMLPKD